MKFLKINQVKKKIALLIKGNSEKSTISIKVTMKGSLVVENCSCGC